jgi:hypothetical protein
MALARRTEASRHFHRTRRVVAAPAGPPARPPLDLPPRVIDPEGDGILFLEEFGRQYRSAPRVSVREYVGDLRIRPPESIPPAEMMAELELLLGELEAHAVHIDFPAHMTSAEMYRFLTTELLSLPIAEVRIPGMVHLFRYADIHHPFHR